jgi:chromosome partitioning protein
VKTALMDYDPQGSSMQWLRARPDQAEKIHGANAAPPKGATIQRSSQVWIPADTEVMIIDAPAGVKGLLLQELVRRTNFIVIPVAPSPIDIHSTADFVKELFLFGGARTSKAKIAVVANRVRSSSSSVYASLERFLNSLKLPFLTNIRDSEVYLDASAKGLGVFEMDEAATAMERRELLPIFHWVDGHYMATDKRARTSQAQENSQPANSFGARIEDKVMNLEAIRATGRFNKLP